MQIIREKMASLVSFLFKCICKFLDERPRTQVDGDIKNVVIDIKDWSTMTVASNFWH